MNTEPKRIVLSGGTRGLGRALIEQFIASGHTVAACARSPDGVERLAAQFRAPHQFARVDVADDRQVRQWSVSVLEGLGPPDLLINNAALINRNAPLWKIGPAEFDQVIDVNIKGVVNLIRHFVPAMIERGRGVIVNFSSGWGRSTSPEVAPYCATKWAIEGLTQALAQELPRGLAAIPLNPGVINTEMLQSCFGSSASAYPTPEQWARKAVPFLLSLRQKHNGLPLSVST